MKFLVVILFSGHGIVKDNKQVILTNEFDKKRKFYRLLKAEEMVRDLSQKNPNTYIVSLFSCNR